MRPAAVDLADVLAVTERVDPRRKDVRDAYGSKVIHEGTIPERLGAVRIME
jgi:hypothetical protein